MPETFIGKLTDSIFSSELLRQLYRFRHRLFKERLGWQGIRELVLVTSTATDLDR